MPIHATAIVDPAAEIDADARIDAYAVVDGPVRIAAGAHLFPHSFVAGWTELGPQCEVHPGAVVGHAPQDFSYDGAETYCRIGAGTVIREGTSVHRGTSPGTATVIGERCLLMAGSHVAHNCVVGDEVVLVNNALLAGHVQVGRKVTFGGKAAAHQFTRIGDFAMIAGSARLQKDVPPFMLTDFEGHILGLNVIGLRRAGFDSAARAELKEAHRVLYRTTDHFPQAVEKLAALAGSEPVKQLLDFVRCNSKRGHAQKARRHRSRPDPE